MALPMILQQLNTNQTPGVQIGQIKNLINVLRNANNPQVLFQNMFAQNPQMKQAIDYVNSNGGDPKKAFEKLALERGVNVGEIESLFK